MKVNGIEVRVGDVWRPGGTAWEWRVTAVGEGSLLGREHGPDGETHERVCLLGPYGRLIRRATDPAGETRDRERWEYADELVSPDPSIPYAWTTYGATYRRALVPAEPLAAVAWQVTREESGIVTVDAGDGRGTFLAVVGAGRDGYTCVGFADDAESRDECVRDPSMISAISSKIPCGMVAGRLSVARWAIMVRG